MMRVRKAYCRVSLRDAQQWMGAMHLLTRKLAGISAAMSLCARPQVETGHENHRYPSPDESANDLKTGLFLRLPMIWRLAGAV